MKNSVTDEYVKYCKEELEKRYGYLIENSVNLLAPFMHQEGSFKKGTLFTKLRNLDSKTLTMIENMLLSGEKLEYTQGYKYFESLKQHVDYLKRIKRGVEIQRAWNERDSYEHPFSVWKILGELYEYIERQSRDETNRERKLQVIDEYCRIARYKNDGSTRTSGYHLKANQGVSNMSNISTYKKKTRLRSLEDRGVLNNPFINQIVDPMQPVHFSEEEKQEIYLRYHDELPWDMEMHCSSNYSFERPEITSSCQNKFNLKENNIFEHNGYFYTLCPSCGYLVVIDDAILSSCMRERIIERSNKDIYSFRKNYLSSELKRLIFLSKQEEYSRKRK